MPTPSHRIEYSDDIYDHRLVTHEKLVAPQKDCVRERNDDHIGQEIGQAANERNVAKHLNVVANNIEPHDNSHRRRDGGDLLIFIKDWRRIHEDGHNRRHHVRDVPRERAKCHQKPRHSQHEEGEGNDNERRQPNCPRYITASHEPEDNKHAEGDASVCEGARSRRPGNRLAWKNGALHEVCMLMQQHRRAVGELAEEIEHDKANENAASIF